MNKLAQIITAVIDFFQRPFDRWVSKELFRYAACGGGNLVFDWLLYFLIYNFVIGHEIIHWSFVIGHWSVGQLSPLFVIGIMLVACSPGGSSSNVFSMLAKGDVALSVTLTACSSIITLFTLPLIMAWVMKSIQFSDVSIQLPIGNLLIQNIVLMVVPIAIGFVVNIFREQTAAKIHNVLKRIAMPALVLLVTVFFVQHKQTIVAEFASLGLTMTILILATTGCGALLAWLLKLTTKERRTLVIEIGMQNAAQAITIACSPLIFNNEIIAIPAIIYALMMNLILLAYVGITAVISLR